MKTISLHAHDQALTLIAQNPMLAYGLAVAALFAAVLWPSKFI